MSSGFESIKQGLTEAIEHAAGQPSQAVVHPPKTTDVKAIREQVGMTQTAFAATFGISLSTLRHWSEVIGRLKDPHACCSMWRLENRRRFCELWGKRVKAIATFALERDAAAIQFADFERLALRLQG